MKEKIKKLLGSYKSIFKKYRLTFILIFINTILIFFGGLENDLTELITALLFTNVLFFTIDTFTKDNRQRLIYYLASLLFSFLLNHLLYQDNVGMKTVLFIFGIYIASFLITIYKISKEEESFSKYILRVFNNDILLATFSFVIQLGLLFICTVVSELLLPNTSVDIYLKAEILFLGFLVSGELLCLISNKNEVIKPIKPLVCYILLPIVLLVHLIMYVYLIKIVIINEIPSNQLYSFITALFILTAPTLIMLDNYTKDNKYFLSIFKIMPYIFIPLVIIQMYSVGVRIYDYGYTIERYLGVMLIAFEIVTIICLIHKKDNNLHKIMLALITLTIITLCIPKLNIIDVSRHSQLNRLLSVYKKDTDYDSLSYKDKETIKSAYFYLTETLDATKYLPEYIDKNKLNYFEVDYIKDYYQEIYYSNKLTEIDVTEYKKIIPFKYYKFDYDEGVSTNELVFEDLNDKSLNEAMQSFIKRTIEIGEVDNYLVKLDDEHFYWISSLTIKYYQNSKKISNINTEGYILTK